MNGPMNGLMDRSMTGMRRQRGITLLELMIVCAIVALISSFAYPSYMRYVTNSKRTAATSALLQVAQRQQQFFMDNKTYANDLTSLGFGANPWVISDEGKSSVAGDPDSVYSISLSNVGTTTYTITAAPLHAQQERDTQCASLTLDQAGTRAASTGNDGCW